MLTDSETLDARLAEITGAARITPLPKPARGSYNVQVRLKTTKRMYVFIGVLGVLVGIAYIFQRHYFFGAIYALFGVIWLLMSRKNPREETAVQPSSMDLEAPARPDQAHVSTVENISKLPQP